MEAQIVDAILAYIIFIVSVTLHEAAHAWAAMRGGDLTAYYGGQVTLDPVPHIKREPFGMVVLPILVLLMGYPWPVGYASAPFNMNWAIRYPKRAAWMALAGPGSNLLLVLIAGVCIFAGLKTGHFTVVEGATRTMTFIGGTSHFTQGLAYFIGLSFTLNLVLFVLNMIPLPPLDGSSAVLMFMDHETACKYQQLIRQPMFAIMGLIIAWNLFKVFFFPVSSFAWKLIFTLAGFPEYTITEGF